MSVAWATAVGTLAAALGSTIGAPGIGDPYFPLDGNGGYRVSDYNVHITYDPAKPEFLAGDTTVTATATQTLSRFDLDLEGFDVTAVTVDGLPARKIAWSDPHELVITPRVPVPKGSPMRVRVVYAGKPVGASWHLLQNGGVDVTGEPHSATAWYPVNDHPSDKATFHLTATVPDGWTAIGDGLPGRTTENKGWKTFRWNEEHPMTSYASTVAIDKFTVHTSKLADGTPVINAYGTNTDIVPDSEAVLPKIMKVLTADFGPYPFESTGSIVVNAALSGGSLALETQTKPTYDEAFYDASASHELAHEWFGDSVSFSDWRDGCIAECFAQYATQLWYEADLGADLNQDYLDQIAQYKDTPTFWNVKLYDPGADQPLAEGLYDKGPLMLQALRATVGDDLFFTTLRTWTATYKYANASWPDFERLAQQVSGKDLTGFFQAWAHSTTIPPDQYLYPGALKP
ncbi:M1 family metallopeptidase [Streptacidiphilus sp. PAMC 29251]